MHILAIDLGNYSVKFISSTVERKKVQHQKMSEIIIADYQKENRIEDFYDAQMMIAREIIDEYKKPDTKVIFQAENEMMTSRFLQLPVKSKKKAELMLPFQLEEDLPYPLSETHYSYRLDNQKTHFSAMVDLANQSLFDEYFSTIQKQRVVPSVLTTETSAVENYFFQKAEPGCFCVIDIGHKTSKAYFFYNSKLIISNLSYFGGHHINEMIAQTYNVDPDEAQIYKHQNAFLLTLNQYSEVNESQREFANSMDRVFSVLNTDFNRWKVGVKVNFDLKLEKVYITGGSSNIKNIVPYLSEKWNIDVQSFNSFEDIDTSKVDLNPKSKTKYFMANLLAYGYKRKDRFINLLTGKYAQASGIDFPLHSYAFIGVRVAAVSLLLAVSLLIQNYFINQDIKSVNAKLTAILRNDELNLNPRLRRSIQNQPDQILSHLTRRTRSIEQEISTLQSAVQIQALSPLVIISQAMGKLDATLIELQVTNDRLVNARFTVRDSETQKKLKTQLENSALLSVSVENIDDKTIQMSAEY
ncbi:MAG: pilus assembly protein PilM [Bacteriovoracaceae bacterium]